MSPAAKISPISARRSCEGGESGLCTSNIGRNSDCAARWSQAVYRSRKPRVYRLREGPVDAGSRRTCFRSLDGDAAGRRNEAGFPTIACAVLLGG